MFWKLLWKIPKNCVLIHTASTHYLCTCKVFVLVGKTSFDPEKWPWSSSLHQKISDTINMEVRRPIASWSVVASLSNGFTSTRNCSPFVPLPSWITCTFSALSLWNETVSCQNTTRRCSRYSLPISWPSLKVVFPVRLLAVFACVFSLLCASVVLKG